MILLTSLLTIFLLWQILLRRKLSILINTDQITLAATILYSFSLLTVRNYIIYALNMNKSSGPNTLKEETFAVECFRKFRENKLLNIKF